MWPDTAPRGYVRSNQEQIFFAILDEMIDDNSAFYHNKATIFDACMNGHAYGLTAGPEADADYDARDEPRAYQGGIFCNTGGWFLLPCVCVLNNTGGVELIWTHSRARLNGFAKFMVILTKATTARNRLQESAKFWKNIEETVWKKQ
jgi:hypothetical protein